MSSSQTLGGNSRAGRILGPSLDKIVKNVAWRKHSQLVSACKSAIDKLETLTDSPDPNPDSPIPGFSSPDADFVLQPLILAVHSASVKIVEAALECIYKLLSQNLIQGEIDRADGAETPQSISSQLFDSVCKCGELSDEGIELAILKVLISAVRSQVLLIRGDCLVQIVKTCYNVYLGSLSNANQICAKASLVQIMMIVYSRVDADSIDISVRAVSVGELLEFSDKNLNDLSMVQSVQNIINEVMEGSESVTGGSNPMQPNGDVSESGENGGVFSGDGESNDGIDSVSKIREDGFSLFKNLCKFSMKFPTQENPEDPLLLRGKILSLELLRVVVYKAGPFWRTNERFLGAIKQYLCLSLLKNSALSVMSIYQLLCSIFMSLLSRFRSVLKSEMGIFFPMLVLRVLENVLQPSFLQKMTVLNLLEKISQDPQIIIDIFVNYDCNVDAPNIFERY